MNNVDNLAKEYRELLTRDESLRALDRCLRLTERVLGVRINVELVTASEASAEEGQQAHGFMAGVAWEDATGEISKEPFEGVELLSFRTRDPRQIFRVVRVGVALKTFPRLAEKREPQLPDERYSLLMDSCMLVFHQAYFALLPTLQKQLDARRFLLNSFKSFADGLGRASDKFTVLALCFDAAKDVERAARYYREAFLASHSDDEDFMSRLQACWQFTIERGQLRQALELVLDVYPRAARKDLDEIRDLIETTFDLSSHRKEAVGR